MVVSRVERVDGGSFLCVGSGGYAPAARVALHAARGTSTPRPSYPPVLHHQMVQRYKTNMEGDFRLVRRAK